MQSRKWYRAIARRMVALGCGCAIFLLPSFLYSGTDGCQCRSCQSYVQPNDGYQEIGNGCGVCEKCFDLWAGYCEERRPKFRRRRISDCQSCYHHHGCPSKSPAVNTKEVSVEPPSEDIPQVNEDAPVATDPNPADTHAPSVPSQDTDLLPENNITVPPNPNSLQNNSTSSTEKPPIVNSDPKNTENTQDVSDETETIEINNIPFNLDSIDLNDADLSDDGTAEVEDSSDMEDPELPSNAVPPSPPHIDGETGDVPVPWNALDVPPNTDPRKRFDGATRLHPDRRLSQKTKPIQRIRVSVKSKPTTRLVNHLKYVSQQ